MEFCPEIAVLHSAFALAEKKAGRKPLSSFRKGDNDDLVAIIHTAVLEITHGIEVDLALSESKEWNHKLHTILLHKLVSTCYVEKSTQEEGEQEKPLTYTSLDMLCGILPDYSTAFFFDIVKKCDWFSLFLQGLQHYEADISATVLQDIVDSCRHTPMPGDTDIVQMLNNSLVASLILLPDDDTTDTGLQQYLSKQCSVTTIWQACLSANSKLLSEILDLILAGIEEDIRSNQVGSCAQELLKTLCQLTVFGCVIVNWEEQSETVCQWLYKNMFPTCNMSNGSRGQSSKIQSLSEFRVHDQSSKGHKYLNSYCLNCKLAQDLSRNFPSNNWIKCVSCLFMENKFYSTQVNKTMGKNEKKHILQNGFDTEVTEAMQLSEEIGEITEKEGNITVNNINGENQESEPVPVGELNQKKTKVDKHPQDVVTLIQEHKPASVCLCRAQSYSMCLRSDLVFRVLLDCLVSLKQKIDLEEDMLTLVEDVEKVVQDICGCYDDSLDDHHLGNWDFLQRGLRELTLDAVLWRIDGLLSHSHDCLDILMSEDCLHFWNDHRVVAVLKGRTEILAKLSIVQQLIHIYKTVQEQQFGTAHQIYELTQEAFSGLPLCDQDVVILREYLDSPVGGLPDTTEENLDQVVTSTFNKVTSNYDGQVMGELCLLALKSPRKIVSTSVRLCVKNLEQAEHMAQILGKLGSVCRCRHPTLHPDSSLLTETVHEVLSSTQLTAKEEQNFIYFLTTVLKDGGEQAGVTKSLLAPAEFLLRSVLPLVNVRNLNRQQGPISCKFALRMLNATLKTTKLCNSKSDWLTFKPVCLLLCLCELLHECVVFWREDQVATDMFVRVTVKELTLQSLTEVLACFGHNREELSEGESSWLVQHLSSLDWTVTVYMRHVLAGHPWFTDFEAKLKKSMFDEEPASMTDSLVCILRYVSMGEKWTALVPSEVQSVRYMEHDLLVALLQATPNMLSDEFCEVVDFVGDLVDQNVLAIPFRAGNLQLIPLTDLTALKSPLCVSQLLKDMLIALNILVDYSCSWTEAMMNHVSQCYVTALKKKTEGISTLVPELQLLLLSQLFSHVCDVTSVLRASAAAENTFVLILHILNQYADMFAKPKFKKLDSRFIDCCCYVISQAVKSLPDEYVQKKVVNKMLTEKLMK